MRCRRDEPYYQLTRKKTEWWVDLCNPGSSQVDRVYLKETYGNMSMIDDIAYIAMKSGKGCVISKKEYDEAVRDGDIDPYYFEDMFIKEWTYVDLREYGGKECYLYTNYMKIHDLHIY